ncbi:hypothetical protein [Caballeronia cordobensis]|uniref:hypothetical protein n=1 Tax=Caballeronia cordobensis TaxID=1353886 RepID=UPI00045EEBCD|nr:hypothetical protein BRPE67_ACDS13340 [Burkholderia sp. RPE67]BBP96282.1 hypothetical protein BSFA1_14110 [Burkholderia sp. SFA1]
MSYQRPDAYFLLRAVRCLDDRAAGRAIDVGDLMLAVDALSSLTESEDCDGYRSSDIIDAREGLKQIAAGMDIPDVPQVRRRARKLATLLLAVAIDRWSPNGVQVAWETSRDGGFAARYGRWEFAMHPVSTPFGISWRWVARRSERYEGDLRLIRVDDGEAHSARAAELYMVMLANESDEARGVLEQGGQTAV